MATPTLPAPSQQIGHGHAAGRDDPLAVAPATATDVLALQNARGLPAVSVLLSTTPAPRITPPDSARLNMLLREAERRLALDATNGQLDPELVAALHGQADAARHAPARSGAALFAGRTARGIDRAAAHSLDVAVKDRVCVGPVFATRDLIRSLHRTPRHLLLVLSNDRAQLYDGLGTRSPRSPQAGRSGDRTAPRQAAPQTSSSRSTTRSASTSTTTPRRCWSPHPPGRDHPGPVARRGHQPTRAAGPARPLAYLLARQLEALALLGTRERQARTVSGLEQVWSAARNGPVEMLAVEEDHFAPARLSADRRRITPAEDPEAPDMLDDTIDEIIDLVLSRGGWVSLVDSGALAEHDHMAISPRRIWSRPGTPDRPGTAPPSTGSSGP